MNPDKIEITNVNKMFEYEMQCRQIDECNDVDVLKQMLKTSIKLFLKQQEVMQNLGF